MSWLRFLGGGRRRRSPWNNVGADGSLTCGLVSTSLLLGGEIGPRDWAALSAAGVSVVVNLQQEQQDAFAPDEKIDGYLWLPAPDGRAPSLEQLSQGVAFMRASIEGGRTVFVHCKAGQGRAPLLCACYLIAQGASTMDAIKQVQAARPATQLTPEQSARLREFAAHVASSSPTSTWSAPREAAGSENPEAQTPFDKALPKDAEEGSKAPAPVVLPAAVPAAKP